MVRNNHRLVEPSLSASMVRADVIGLLSFNVGPLSVKVAYGEQRNSEVS